MLDNFHSWNHHGNQFSHLVLWHSSYSSSCELLGVQHTLILEIMLNSETQGHWLK